MRTYIHIRIRIHPSYLQLRAPLQASTELYRTFVVQCKYRALIRCSIASGNHGYRKNTVISYFSYFGTVYKSGLSRDITALPGISPSISAIRASFVSGKYGFWTYYYIHKAGDNTKHQKQNFTKENKMNKTILTDQFLYSIWFRNEYQIQKNHRK